MMRWLLGIVLAVATLGGVGTAHADYEAGQRAWDAGRHSEALQEWQASANAGDAKAMLALGRLYVQGLGVPQNYVHAHVWFSLAASKFEAEAVKERDALAARMAPEQVAEAQKLAAAWQPQAAEASAGPGASGSAGASTPQSHPGGAATPGPPWAMSRTRRTGSGVSARPKPIRRLCGTRTCRLARP